MRRIRFHSYPNIAYAVKQNFFIFVQSKKHYYQLSARNLVTVPMNRCLKLFFILFITSQLLHSAQQEKVFHLKQLPKPAVIDGVIDPIWDEADSVSDFVQQSPYHWKPTSKKTVAKLFTTSEAIYCLLVCYDERKNIQNHTGKLDDGGGDIVSVMFDTFGDKRTAYKFAVNSAGVRADCILLDDARNRDYNWDGVWFSGAKIYDWGFVIEMEIPYRSVQYNENLTEWGLDFDRWVPMLSEDTYWNAYEENEGQRISKFGKLIFDDFKPTVKGLNLEVYPVGISKATYIDDGKYKISPNAGIDLFYNPSPKLTFQLTANPDFAQIEADPFNFNVSRYETYFNERRPFFTQGNEIFIASGKEQSTGFYSPLELFYSRRIGKVLPDGSDIPIVVGAKGFGRIDDLDYGAFMAMTDQSNYFNNDTLYSEEKAVFGSARIKKRIFDNSTIGMLMVAKKTANDVNAVFDIDGAIRQSDWQLSYQFARSFKNSNGDYAASFGLVMPKENTFILSRGKFIGNNFDISEVGYVPWKGTAELTSIAGPRWFFKDGYISQLLLLGGGGVYYQDAELYYNRNAIFVFNMQFRNNWGYEFDFSTGRSKDQGIIYDSYELDFSNWYNISPKWDANLWGTIAKTYNFSRDYLALYGAIGSYIEWYMFDILQIGTSFNTYIEGNPDHHVEDVTYNSRPFFSLTPVNDMNFRVYFDNVYTQSSGRFQHLILGFLFSYNFSPKSWIYLAINEIHDRSDEFDADGNLLPNRLHVAERVGVFKIKYLYYF